MKSDTGGAACGLGRSGPWRAPGATPRERPALPGRERHRPGRVQERRHPDPVLGDARGDQQHRRGRLVLADGASFAARKLKAEIVLDAATLGRAARGDRALRRACSRGRGPRGRAGRCRTAHEELVHRCPPPSSTARSSPGSRTSATAADRMNAQSSCAGEFIRWQLDGTMPAGHVDMAGPSTTGGRGSVSARPCWPRRATPGPRRLPRGWPSALPSGGAAEQAPASPGPAPPGLAGAATLGAGPWSQFLRFPHRDQLARGPVRGAASPAPPAAGRPEVDQPSPVLHGRSPPRARRAVPAEDPRIRRAPRPTIANAQPLASECFEVVVGLHPAAVARGTRAGRPPPGAPQA